MNTRTVKLKQGNAPQAAINLHACSFGPGKVWVSRFGSDHYVPKLSLVLSAAEALTLADELIEAAAVAGRVRHTSQSAEVAHGEA